MVVRVIIINLFIRGISLLGLSELIIGLIVWVIRIVIDMGVSRIIRFNIANPNEVIPVCEVAVKTIRVIVIPRMIRDIRAITSQSQVRPFGLLEIIGSFGLLWCPLCLIDLFGLFRLLVSFSQLSTFGQLSTFWL